MEEQLVGLFRGGVAVVARDGELDIGGQQRAAKGGDFCQHLVDDVDGIGAGAFGDGQRYGRFQTPAGGAMQNIIGRFGGPVADGGDVAQVDWPPGLSTDDDETDGFGLGQEVTGFE